MSDRICGITGVLGAVVANQDADIVERSYHSDSAQAILEDLTPLLHRIVRRCAVHNPDLQHVRLRFQDLTVFVKMCEPGFIVTLCQNDVIIYLLERSITSIIAETQTPKVE